MNKKLKEILIILAIIIALIIWFSIVVIDSFNEIRLSISFNNGDIDEKEFYNKCTNLFFKTDGNCIDIIENKRFRDGLLEGGNDEKRT